MTVALVAHYLGPKLGIGQYIDRLIPPLTEELKAKSLDYLILCSPNAMQQTPALQDSPDSIKVLHSLDASPLKRYIWFALKFASYCQKHGITKVIWLSNPIVMPWHPTTIAVLHDVNEWKIANKYGSYLKTALRSLIYLDASLWFSYKVITVSQATAHDLLEFRPDSSIQAKLKIIQNGTDSQLTRFLPVFIPRPRNPYFLSVGRIDPQAKRLPEAVALINELRKHTRHQWELHILGGMNTSTQAAGEAFLQDIESFDWIHYHGHVSDAELAEWYRHAQAVIFLSDNEGFGFPVAEAASFGRWSVVSDKNSVATEFGASTLIPVDADNPKNAARTLAACLQKNAYPPQSKLQTWKEVAAAYVTEIEAIS